MHVSNCSEFLLKAVFDLAAKRQESTIGDLFLSDCVHTNMFLVNSIYIKLFIS